MPTSHQTIPTRNPCAGARAFSRVRANAGFGLAGSTRGYRLKATRGVSREPSQAPALVHFRPGTQAVCRSATSEHARVTHGLAKKGDLVLTNGKPAAILLRIQEEMSEGTTPLP